MKKVLLALTVMLLALPFAKAQKSLNLNKLPFITFEEKYLATAELNFDDAIRFREIVLNEQIQSDQLIQINDRIQLDLFADKTYQAKVDKISTDVNGTLMVRAKIDHYELAYCFISTFEGKTFMVIEIPEEDELYMSRYNHSTKKYHLLQMDKTSLNPIEACFGDDLNIDQLQDSGNHGSHKHQHTHKGPTTRDTVTLMVVYTPAAASWSAANEVSINNTISLMMARADLTNDNTDSLLYIQLVYSDSVAYTELQSVTDLFNLRNTTDGNMDSVHVLRDDYCADLVTLMIRTNHTGGTAFLLNNLSGSPANGFSILRVQQSSWTYTAIHEFGHNLGCGHHKFQNFQAGPGIFTYSAGGRWVSVPSGNYCSVMSYESGTYYTNGISHTRVPYFSNPSKFYLGTATGDSTDADNARSIRTTKSIVAGYRSGCTLPAPVTVSGNNGTYCDSVVLRASGGNRGTIYWQGTVSGGTSTANQVDTQTVTASGTYYFRAQNLQGWGPEGSSSVTIINNAPSAAGTISGPATVCTGQTIGYSVPAISGASAYTWTVPSGFSGRSSSDSITLFVTNTAVSGNITVSGTNACGNGVTATFAVVVNPIPANAGTISGNINPCLSQTYTYTVPPIADASTYIWTLPTGATGSSNADTIDVTFSNSAVSGDITVTGSNNCGNGNSSSLSITVNPIPANAGVISGNTNPCLGQTFTYRVPPIQDATTYLWTLPTGASGTSNADTINVSFSNSAVSGDITVTGSNSCGSGNSSTLSITLNPLPLADAGADQSICNGNTATLGGSPTGPAGSTYLWDNAASLNNANAANPIATPNVTTSYTVTVTDVNGCTDIDQLTITVDPLPIADAGADQSICANQTATIGGGPTGPSGATYNWTPAASLNNSAIANPVANPTSSTTYTVTVTDVNGCSNTDSVLITVNPLPNANAGVNQTICVGQSATLGGSPTSTSPGATYSWDNAVTLSSASLANPIATPTVTTTYNVTVTDGNGCTNTDQVMITVNPLPAVDAGHDLSICAGDSSVIGGSPTSSTAGVSYAWDNAASLNNANAANPMAMPLATTTYTVTITDANGCTDTDQMTLTVNPKPATPTVSANSFVLTSDAPLGNQWYDQNGMINGATGQTYTSTSNGNYYTIVTLMGCESDTSNVINVTSTGIESMGNELEFKVFPNPFKNDLTIQFDGKDENASVQIMNTSGQLVYQAAFTKRLVIQTDQFANGIYFVKVESKSLYKITKLIKH